MASEEGTVGNLNPSFVSTTECHQAFASVDGNNIADLDFLCTKPTCHVHDSDSCLVTGELPEL